MKLTPTLRQLAYLVALSEHRHFGRAAEACFVTQSTLSAGLQELEAILETRLVERTKRSVLFTPLGETVVAHARTVLGAVEDLVDAAQAGREPLAGRLRLGVIPTLGPFLLPRVIPALQTGYPRLKLELVEDLTARLVERLMAGALDVLLLALPCDCGDGETVPLFDDPFHLACRPDHPLATATPLTTARLAGERLLLLADGHCLREHALAACHIAHAPEGAFEATSLHTLVQMAATGLGVTLLPEIAIEAGILNGVDLAVRPFADDHPARQVGLAWRRASARRSEFLLLGDVLRRIVAHPADQTHRKEYA